LRPPAILAILAAALASFALAGGPADPTPAQVARQFERDAPLLRALVDRGVKLAGENDPLGRAHVCNDLVHDLAEELQQSATDGHMPRALALGTHLQTLLKRGMVPNVNLVHLNSSPSSTRAAELQRVWQRTREITHSVDEALRNAAGMDRQIEPIRAAVSDGWETFDRAVHGKGPARTKPVTPGQ
jgi:hypothetical protein